MISVAVIVIGLGKELEAVTIAGATADATSYGNGGCGIRGDEFDRDDFAFTELDGCRERHASGIEFVAATLNDRYVGSLPGNHTQRNIEPKTRPAPRWAEIWVRHAHPEIHGCLP